MSNDTTLERIWEARRRIYERCGNDPVKLVEYYLNRQREQLSETPLTPNEAINAIVCQNPQEEVVYQPSV